MAFTPCLPVHTPATHPVGFLLWISIMSLNSPTYKSARAIPRPVFPNSMPDTRVPRPRVFPGNINRPPTVSVPIRGPAPRIGSALYLGAAVRVAQEIASKAGLRPFGESTVVNERWGTSGQWPTFGWYREFNPVDYPTIRGVLPARINAGLKAPDWVPTPAVLSGAGLHVSWIGVDIGPVVNGFKSVWYHTPVQPLIVTANAPQPGLTIYEWPYHSPAQVPRNYPRPEPVPSLRVPSPRIRPGIGFDLRPNAPPRPVYVPGTRPPRGTREGKTAGAAATAVAIVARALDFATEVADVLAIFWDHIQRVTPGGQRTFYETMEVMMENPSLWAQVDWDGMVRDMIMNEVEDQVVGRVHGLKRRLQSEWGTPTYGGAFKGP